MIKYKLTLKEFFESNQLLAINLKTKEQSIIFSKEADKLGKKWGSGKSYLEFNFWDEYQEETCYDNENEYQKFSYYHEVEKCKILKFEDIEWEELKEELKMNNFTKKDIKNGAVVELRNGQRYLKVDNTLLSLEMNGEFTLLNKYNDFTLLNKNLNKYDIMKVLNPSENALHKEACNLALCDVRKNNKDIKWTWERKQKRMKKVKLKDLTLDQYIKWQDKNCLNIKCKDCNFHKVSCDERKDDCWIKNKDLYSEKFLNQEIEIEEEK